MLCTFLFSSNSSVSGASRPDAWTSWQRPNLPRLPALLMVRSEEWAASPIFLIRNIPSEWHSLDLRRHFEAFVERNRFRCFHFPRSAFQNCILCLFWLLGGQFALDGAGETARLGSVRVQHDSGQASAAIVAVRPQWHILTRTWSRPDARTQTARARAATRASVARPGAQSARFGRF